MSPLAGLILLFMPSTPHLGQRLGFRPDIQGLRAVAVSLVLLFHFQLMGFGFGFIGVDLFFVISGYLMTGILLQYQQINVNTYLQFFASRAIRILPALVMLVCGMYLLGYFFLPSAEYQELSKEIKNAILFKSNTFYLSNLGYFDTSAHEKWLLHTWSLSIEWQFYLMFPLVFLVGLFKKWIKTTLVLGIAASLLFSLLTNSKNPDGAFYLLPSRIWEMLFGGLAYVFFLQPKPEKQVHLLGVSLLLIGFAILSFEDQWQPQFALLPVLGISLMLASQYQNPVLTHHIFQWIGTRSYSLYLWHWPIVVGLYVADLLTSPYWVGAGLLLSVLLSHLSYHLIERNAQQTLRTMSHVKIALVSIAVIAAISSLPSVIAKLNLDGRLADHIEHNARQSQLRNLHAQDCIQRSDNTGQAIPCHFGDVAWPVGAILIGDSHAQATTDALLQQAQQRRQRLLLLAMSGCPTIFEVKYAAAAKKPTLKCAKFNQQAFDILKQYPNTPVVIVNRLNYAIFGANETKKNSGQPLIYLNRESTDANHPDFQTEIKRGIQTTVCAITASHPVFLTHPIPEMGFNVPKKLLTQQSFGNHAEVSIDASVYLQRSRYVINTLNDVASTCGAHILKPQDYLCNASYCFGSKSGRALYFDDDHLNHAGNQLLSPMFAVVFDSQKR